MNFQMTLEKPSRRDRDCRCQCKSKSHNRSSWRLRPSWEHDQFNQVKVSKPKPLYEACDSKALEIIFHNKLTIKVEYKIDVIHYVNKKIMAFIELNKKYT